ncbi:hypothetical protein [Streptomyces sp. NPDC096013]|uniref:hypothetical protein n=1 Tax=Streptomyces sp. NPDC096013 TaxID=3366069 RepID=UPI0037FF5030
MIASRITGIQVLQEKKSSTQKRGTHMSGPSGGSAEHSLDWGKDVPSLSNVLQAYFRKDEAKTLTMKVTAINHSLDYVKIGLAAVATGLTLVKVDFTLFKVDEKGISWLGNSLYAFPWTKPDNKWWHRVMPDKIVRRLETEDQEKKNKEQEQKQEMMRRLAQEKQQIRTWAKGTFYKAAQGQDLHSDVRLAQRTADEAKSGVDDLRSRLRAAGSAGKPQAPKPRDSTAKNLVALTGSVNTLSQALAGI